jgi:hypothetical protein
VSNVNWGKFGTTIGGYILGGLVGLLIGGPSGFAIGAALGGVIGGVVGSLAFPDTTTTRLQGPRLQNFVQTSEYGWPIPILIGHDRLGGCVIWAAERQEHMRETEESEGGKGGGSESTVIYQTYYYTQSFAVKICRGPVAKLFRIWADNKLIYDCKPENDGPVIGQGLNFTFYGGAEDQTSDPVIESYEGAGNVPANRGDCYCVFEDLNITDYGGRIPNLNFEAATESEDAYPEIEVDLTDLISASPLQRMGHNGEYAVLCNLDGKFVTVDLLSNRVLGAKDFEVDCIDFERIDAEGDIYTMIQDGAQIYHPVCINQNLNVVREGDTFEGSAFIGTATAEDNVYLYIAARTYHGIQGAYYSEVWVLNKKDFKTLWQWEQIVDRNLDGNGAIIRALCIANDYICWALVDYISADVPTGYTRLVWLCPFIGWKTWYTITSEGSETHPTAIGHDPVTGYIMLSDESSTIWIWDPDTCEISKQFGPQSQDGHDYRAHQDNLRNTINGLLWCGRDGAHFVAINLATLEVVREYDKSNWSPSTSEDHALYDPTCNALWPGLKSAGDDKTLYKFPLDRATRATVLLGSDIVQAICEEVGLTAADLDLTEIATDEVRGYCIAAQQAARQAIEPLQQAFFWDCAEIDGKITAVKRGGASVVTIPEGDLATHEGGQERPDELPITRGQEVDLPRVLNVEYVDINQSYQAGTQRSIRQTTDSVGETTITLPLVLTATEAKRIAETLHQIAWLERNSYAPAYLPPQYLYLTVTDVITVERGGNAYLLHIQKIDLGANYLMKVEAIPEDAAVYDSYVEGEAGEHIPQQTINYPGATEFWPVDTPYLRDNENYVSPYGFYVAAAGRLEAWRGAQLFRSLDEGVSYQVIQAMLNGAVMGRAEDILGTPGDPWTWDYHQVIVRLINDEMELTNCSKLNALSGQNAFLLGRPDTGWELCAFCEATLNEDGTYTLGALLRAMRGTEWMCDQHAAGDIFILLSVSTTYRIDGQAADLDKERLYKAISLGMPFSSATLRTFTNTGRGLMPYAPVHIKGNRDGSSNLTVNWVRRSRIGGDWLADALLDETSEAYEVDIIKDDEVVRTIDELSSPECSYSAADQTTDGFTPGDPIPVEVFQVSAAVGRGFAGPATI